MDLSTLSPEVRELAFWLQDKIYTEGIAGVHYLNKVETTRTPAKSCIIAWLLILLTLRRGRINIIVDRFTPDTDLSADIDTEPGSDEERDRDPNAGCLMRARPRQQSGNDTVQYSTVQ